MAFQRDASIDSMPMADLKAFGDHLLGMTSNMHAVLHVPDVITDAKLTQSSLQQNANVEADAIRTVQDQQNPSIDNLWQDSEVPDTQDANHHHQHTSKAEPARLKTTQSAPEPVTTKMTEDMQAHLLTTFHVLPGGDTQPNESQLYRDFRNNTSTTPLRPITFIEGTTGGKSYDGSYTGLGSAEAAAEQSYIDLAQSWPENMSPDTRSDGGSTQTQTKHTREVTFPKTPQLAGSKRGSDGEVLPVDDTAVYDGMFGSVKTPAFNALEAFNQTQAISSPLPRGFRSDPILTRPSPNMQEIGNTSNNGYSSSPILQRNARLDTDEPRNRYVSMRESQDQRAQTYNELAGIVEEDDPFSDSPGPPYKPWIRRHVSEHTLRNSEAAGLHSKPNSSAMLNTRRDMVSVDNRKGDQSNKHVDGVMSSPIAKSGSIAHIPIIIPEDAGSSDDGEDEEEEVEENALLPEDRPHLQEEFADYLQDKDVYNEYAEAIQRSEPADEQDEVDDFEDDIVQPHKRTKIDDESTYEEDFVPGSQVSQYGVNRVFHVSQPVTLGSQAVPQSEKRSLMITNQPSSVTSVIPGSQYGAHTSERQLNPSRLLPGSQIATSRLIATSNSKTRLTSSPPVDDGDKIDHDAEEDDIDGAEPTTPARSIAMEIDALSPHSDDEEPDATPTRSSFIAPRPASSQQEIAESSARHHDALHDNGSGQAFATAHTHLSPSKSRSLGQTTVTQDSIPTPLKTAGVTRLADILLTQPRREDTLDLDGIMNDVITRDDQYYMDIMSSPIAEIPRKRRRMNWTIQSSDSNSQQNEESELSNARQPLFNTGQHDNITNPEKAHCEPHDNDTPHEDDTAVDTPNSVKFREAEGAKAVSQLVISRTENQVPLAKLSGPGKRTYSRVSRSNPSNDPYALPSTQNAIDTASKRRGESASEAYVQPLMLPVEAANVDDNTITRPDRVFALFKGSYDKFYPATIIGRSTETDTLQVRFDDQTEAIVKSIEVAPLIFRAGDIFKVDLPGKRSVWVVHSTSGRTTAEHTTDIYGRSIIVGFPKSGKRMSLEDTKQDEHMTKINIKDIYLTHTMISAYRKREIEISTLTNMARPSTPSLTTASTRTNTPKSRSGRHATRRQHFLPSSSATEDVQSPLPGKSGGVFANMAFAITLNGDSEAEKQALTSRIQLYGGTILEGGFDELFESVDEVLARKTTDTSKLSIKAQYQKLGFVALIADRHSRKVKYMQALALGLPTLSPRWVYDTIEKGHEANSAIPPWQKYLLPAGQSSYLNGAIRSRVLNIYPSDKAFFSDVIDSRERLLDGDGVVIVVPQKSRGNNQWERRKPFAFLTLAIGAGAVKRVADLTEAESLATSDEQWKWIYTDTGVVEAAKKLTFLDKSCESKKRKRVAESTDHDSKLFINSQDSGLTVVGDEFVIQSLILGALIN